MQSRRYLWVTFLLATAAACGGGGEQAVQEYSQAAVKEEPALPAEPAAAEPAPAPSQALPRRPAEKPPAPVVEKAPPRSVEGTGGAGGRVVTADPVPADPVTPPAAPRPTAPSPAIGPAPAPSPPPPPKFVVLPEGTVLQVRLGQRISSDVNQTGDRFEAVLDRDLVVDGEVVVPKGAEITGELIEVDEAGRVKGRARVEMVLRKIQVEDDSYTVRTNSVAFEAEGSKERDAKIIGGAAAVGAIIGGIAGGKKGAAIGAASGGGAGTGAVLLTKGKSVELDREQLLSFRLEEPVKVRLE